MKPYYEHAGKYGIMSLYAMRLRLFSGTIKR